MIIISLETLPKNDELHFQNKKRGCPLWLWRQSVCGLPAEDSDVFPGSNGGGSPSGPNFTGSNAIDELFTERFCLQIQ